VNENWRAELARAMASLDAANDALQEARRKLNEAFPEASWPDPATHTTYVKMETQHTREKFVA
jgi:hypothetical protein